MIIIKQLSAEFQIQLSAELADSIADVFRLQLDVFLRIKTDLHCPYLHKYINTVYKNK